MPNFDLISERNVHIVFATSDPEKANKMLASVADMLPNHTFSIAALFIGQQSTIDLNSFCMPVKNIGVYEDYLPISRSRNLCQAYLQQAMKKYSGLGLVLDDDLRWVMQEEEFETLCKQLMAKEVDMAFSTLMGDAPVPKEYARASPLLDMLLAIGVNETSPAATNIIEFTKEVRVAGHIDRNLNAHHDYYSYQKDNFYQSSVYIDSCDWNDFICRLSLGKMTTRPMSIQNKITLATGRERGGATLIFNPSVLSYANQSIQCEDITSRRSDMLMASNVKNSGFVLFNTPAIFSHNRTDSFDSNDSDKLIGDIIGYALVESYRFGTYSLSKFSTSLSQRLLNTVSILQETSHMLVLLRDWLREQRMTTSLIEEKIELITCENSETILDIQSLNISNVILAFKELSHSCKLFKKAG